MPYYSVRQGFVLDHNGKRYHPGQQIDLTEEEAKLYPHQIEPWISRKDKKKRRRKANAEIALELDTWLDNQIKPMPLVKITLEDMTNCLDDGSRPNT